ncbi:hypothetical protein EDD21DRAFT_106962, partial [Dissophora ornata]
FFGQLTSIFHFIQKGHLFPCPFLPFFLLAASFYVSPSLAVFPVLNCLFPSSPPTCPHQSTFSSAPCLHSSTLVPPFSHQQVSQRTHIHSDNMQALTPLLFSMLFPRFGGKDTTDRDSSLEGDCVHESLLGGRSSEEPSFQEGYSVHGHVHHQEQRSAANVRRHRSMDSNTIHHSATDPSSNRLSRNNTFPRSRRAGPPKRLSLDRAAFMATYPMLDGLGDTSVSSNEEYYGPMMPRKSTASSARNMRKQQSQDMSLSRASTSSISSMVSDASSSSSESASSSIRAPLTPTRSPNYRSTVKMASSAKKSGSKAPVNNAKDLINLHHLGEDEGEACLSPQSNNFFNEEDQYSQQTDAILSASATGFEVAAVARAQRQLIAH